MDGDEVPSVDVVFLGQVLHRHQEQVKVVDAGRLDDPVHPRREEAFARFVLTIGEEVRLGQRRRQATAERGCAGLLALRDLLEFVEHEGLGAAVPELAPEGVRAVFKSFRRLVEALGEVGRLVLRESGIRLEQKLDGVLDACSVDARVVEDFGCVSRDAENAGRLRMQVGAR